MTEPNIKKEDLEHLANLARIKLDPEKEAKLLEDIRQIVGYVSEVQELDTSGAEPMNGGTLLKNAFRQDDFTANTNRGAGTKQFSKAEDGRLKVPAVFADKSE